MILSEWDLTGKVALVTGDQAGWTATLAAALAEAGADVAAIGLCKTMRQEAVETVKGLGRKAIGIPTDLTQEDEVRTAVQETISNLGKLDILVNAAQVGFSKPFLEITGEEWDRVMADNVKSMFICSREAGRVMLDNGGGRIVNIISGLSERGLWEAAPYCASQGAALQLTRALALEWARRDIRVNAIGTGWYTMETVDPDQAQKERLVRYIPSRRKGHPRDIGPLLVYLASDACDYVTGTCVFVDGGLLAHA